MSSLRLSESEVEITLRQVNAMRQQGEELVACKLFLRAIEIFQQGLTLLSFIGSNPVTRKEEIEEIRVKLFFKLAICYYQVKKPRYILRMLEHVGRFVDVQTVPKALFCYGRAYQMLGQTGMAIKYYEDALKLEPENQAFWNVLSKLRETWQESAENKQSTDQGLSILESTKKLEPVSNEAKYLEATETKIMEIVETRDLKKEELKDLVPTQKIESVPTLEPTEAENMEIIETRDLESTGLKDLKSVEKTDLENEKTIDLKNKDLERTDTNDLETTETIEATGSQATGSQATGLQATGSHATGSQATGSQATGSLASESNALVPTSSEVELLDYDEHDETEELCDFLAALGGKFVLPDGLSNDQVAGAHVLATQFNKLFDQTGKDPKLKFINKPK